ARLGPIPAAVRSMGDDPPRACSAIQPMDTVIHDVSNARSARRGEIPDLGIDDHPEDSGSSQMSSHHHDLIVIGSGPAGQKGAIAAAKLGKDVAIIDREKTVGGVRLHGGTVPSKTLREAILHLTGFRQRSFYGTDYAVKDRISISDLQRRILTVIERE